MKIRSHHNQIIADSMDRLAQTAQMPTDFLIAAYGISDEVRNAEYGKTSLLVIEFQQLLQWRMEGRDTYGCYPANLIAA